MADLLRNFPNLTPAMQQRILNSPATALPEGVKPNFENPPKDNAAGIALGTICLTLTSLAVLCRVYTRVFVIKRLYFEDYVGLLGFASFISFTWVYFSFLNYPGFYRHQWDIRLGDFLELTKLLTFALTTTYAASLLFLKTAILLEWMRIFSPHRTKAFFSYAAWILIIFNLILYISSIVASVITCIPHRAVWEPWVEGKCINRRAVGIATAAFNVFADILILFLPQRIIWTLKMGTTRKVGISLIFSVGLLAIVCAAGRVAVTFDIDYKGDATYTVTPTLLWAYAELTCVILVFCMPAIPKLFSDQTVFTKMLHSLRSWTRLSTRASHKISDGNGDNTRWPASTKRQNRSQENAILDASDHDANLAELQVLQQNNRHILGKQTTKSQEIHSQQPSVLATPATSSGSIMRTAEVQQEIDSAHDFSSDYNVKRQHPWMGQ